MTILFTKKYSELLLQPINVIYDELKSVRKEVFADDERLLFIDDVVDNEDKTYLEKHLDRVLLSLDIDKFFIKIVNRGNILVNNPTNYNIPDTVCVTPWASIDMQVSGDIRVCCLWDRDKPENDKTLLEYFNSEKLQDIRSRFLKGERPSECHRCWKMEDSGGRSKRQLDNWLFEAWHVDYNNIEEAKLITFGVEPGNKCNLACRICNSQYSSTWAQFEDGPVAEYKWIDEDSSEFWDDIIEISENLKYIRFMGGEPLLEKSHRKLLKYLIDKNLSQHISLHYNTNGTVYADFLFDYWDKFYNVELSFSIDNLNKKFEYERFGVPWSKVMENMIKYTKKTYTLDFHTVVGALNILDCGEVHKLATRLGMPIRFNMVDYPLELAVTNLPDEAKSSIEKKLLSYDNEDFLERITPVINIMKSKPMISSLEKFLESQDRKRSQKFKDFYPELYALINGETSNVS